MNGRDPPTGPSYTPASSTINRNDGRRQFAGLNDTLRQGAAAPNPNVSTGGQRHLGPQNITVPPRSSSGAHERPGSQQGFHPPHLRSQDNRPTNPANYSQLPNKPPVVVSQRSNIAHPTTVNPQRALLIEQPDAPGIQGPPGPRDVRQSNMPQQHVHPNTARPDMPRMQSGTMNTGPDMRGHPNMPNTDPRSGVSMPAASPHNGSFNGRPPPTANNQMQYDRRNEVNQVPVQTRSHRETHNEQRREDDRTRRDERNKGRDERGVDRPLHNDHHNSSRHPERSREASQDKRIESEKDRIMRMREKDIVGRSSRPESREGARRGEEAERNPRGNKDLMSTAMPDHRERDRPNRERSRDDRGGSNRVDLMGPQRVLDAPPQRQGGPSAEHRPSGAYNTDRRENENRGVDNRGVDNRGAIRGDNRGDNRGHNMDENRGDNRGDNRGNARGGDGRIENRRGDHGRDRMNGGGSDRMKREYAGTDEGSRENKRLRRGNQ